MKHNDIPTKFGNDVAPASGCGMFVMGVILAFSCVIAISLVLIAQPLYLELIR